jgi:hypothetical protein
LIFHQLFLHYPTEKLLRLQFRHLLIAYACCHNTP